MLRNIANPPPGATLLTLGMLPESELSDLDEALVGNLESGGSLRAENTHAELVHRYASRTVARRVFEYLEPRIGRMPCRPQAALLAYALRVDESRGSDFLDRALKDRQSTGCYQIVLSDVARLKMTPVVLSEAAAHINDSSIEVVVSAVEAMGRDRGPSSRGLLLERFRRWHDAWQGRENELQFDPLVVRRGMSEGMIELTLLRVLSQGQLDAREIAELQSLCVTATCRADAGRLGK